MDYEVFLLSRIKEAYDRDGHPSTSIIEGLENTGSIITSAALLMIIVTSVFAFTSKKQYLTFIDSNLENDVEKIAIPFVLYLQMETVHNLPLPRHVPRL